MSPLLIVGVMVAGGLALMVIVYTIIKRQLEQLKTAMRANVPDHVRVLKGPESANYRGHQNMSVPVRGNGVLLLTDHALRFMRLLPRKEFVIPLGQITRVTVQRAFKGSAKGTHPVLVIHFQAGAEPDAVGFIVANSERQRWIEAITRAANVPFVPG